MVHHDRSCRFCRYSTICVFAVLNREFLFKNECEKKGIGYPERNRQRGSFEFQYGQSSYPSEISALVAELNRELRISDKPRPSLCWELGHAIGEICRKNGYQDGLLEGVVPLGVIRLEMPLEELLHVSWLAHLGFQHMMPNYRGVEIHRFDGAHDAREGARSVGVLECAIPKSERPFDDLRTRVLSREKMIGDWWTEKPASLHVA